MYRVSITPKENLQRMSSSFETPDKKIYERYPKEASGRQIKELLEEARGLTLEDAKTRLLIDYTAKQICADIDVDIKSHADEKGLKIIEDLKEITDKTKKLSDGLEPYLTMLKNLDNDDLYIIAISEIK